MNARPWILSLLTVLVLIGSAAFFSFILMWGMMHFEESVKPYAYALFGVISLGIIVAAGLFAGPFGDWAGKRLFPDSSAASLLVSLSAAVLAIVVGAAAMLVASAGARAVFDDPLPREGAMMRVRFPDGARLVRHSDHTYDTKLIVRFAAAEWEEFRSNDLFRLDAPSVSDAPPGVDLRDLNAFEHSGVEPHEYRWTNHNEPARLRVIAFRAEDGRIFAYLYLSRNYKSVQ